MQLFKILFSFFFAFCCITFQHSFVIAQQVPPWVHTEQQVLPDQFESNDSLNEVDNELTKPDSIQEAKVSFANVDVPIFTDSIYRSRLGNIATPVPLLYNEEVRKYIDLYVLNRREQVSRMLGLSKIYFPIFDQIFTQYGIPLELKYLSIIESALNPHAVSRAGATGIWQFMYGTAKVYGLTMNSYVDERRDIIRSTEGAAQYLKSMYDVYGDWLLAVASYNCGPGNVNRAITLTGGKTFWEIRDRLPKETRNYVPAFIAATYVMNYYELHDLHPEYPKYSFEAITSVEVTDKMACEEIVKFTGMNMDEFKFLNPGLKCNMIPGNPSSYFCKLPADRVSLFDEKRDSIILFSATAKTIYYPGYEAGGGRITYTVRRGDNLGKIAAKYHVTVSQLKKWNRLHSSTIRIGQKLKIYKPEPNVANTATAKAPTTQNQTIMIAGGTPKSPPIDSTAVATTSDTGNTTKQISAAPKKTTSSITSAENKEYVYYKAKYGDTLWDIARRHGTTVTDIRELNGPSKCNKLKAGTVLKLSTKG